MHITGFTLVSLVITSAMRPCSPIITQLFQFHKSRYNTDVNAKRRYTFVFNSEPREIYANLAAVTMSINCNGGVRSPLETSCLGS